MKYLGKSVSVIFEEQLEGWYRVPEVWPAKRDSTTFQSWFEGKRLSRKMQETKILTV